MNEHQKIEEVFFAPVGTTVMAHDTRIVERDGWYQITTPSSGSAISNEVVWSRIAAADAEATVRSVIVHYAEHGNPFLWQVGPPTEPADLGSVLERHGFTIIEYRGMAIATDGWTAQPPPGVSVELVTPDTLGEVADTYARGWSSEYPIDVPAWRDQHARAIAAGTHELYIARLDGVAVATAGTALKQRSGYLTGGHVLTEHRGRGVYRALVGTRVRALAARGIALATTQAREASSAPMLAHFGFETVYRGRVYKLADPRAAVSRFAL